MIRRLKKDVLAELPDKIHSVVPMPCDHASLKIAIKGEMAVVEKAHKLYEGIKQMPADPNLKGALSMHGEPVTTDPATFAKRIATEVPVWGAVIQREKISLD